MTIGILREFDFYPFTLKIPKDWKKLYLSFSQIGAVLQSGKLDAAPYPYTYLNLLVEGYEPSELSLTLTKGARSLILISKFPIENIDDFTLGLVQGYEPILHCVEPILERMILGKTFKIRVFPDIFNADAFLIYGDRALRGDFGEYKYVYNLVEGYITVAVWVVRSDLKDDIIPHIGNSLAHWYMDMEGYVLKYAKHKGLDKEILIEHAKGLKFKYGG
ncbi:MAG: hypothetical protein ABIL27_03055 [candidate division WOR-3 bacterium]